MDRMSAQQKNSVLEKALAYTSVSIIVVAVASFITTLIVAMVAGRGDTLSQLWKIVAAIAYIGLPVGFLLLIALLVINFTRRGREK